MEAREVVNEKNAISKREEALKGMSMTLVNAIRKLGWPDSNGRQQYGNAAILCYLSRHSDSAKRFIEQHKDMRLSDLISQYT